MYISKNSYFTKGNDKKIFSLFSIHFLNVILMFKWHFNIANLAANVPLCTGNFAKLPILYECNEIRHFKLFCAI